MTVAASPVRVPLIDLAEQHAPLHDEILAAWSRILRAGAFVSGPEVAAFEQEFAAACETRHCVAVSTGTDALVLGLRALGAGPGDRVIVPANTFVATVEAVSLVGAIPVLVDCDPPTRTISVEGVERELRRHGAAGIMAVHLYGHPADMDALARVAAEHGAWIVEDAAQAHLARCHGTRAGALGHIGCFSFYPSKNLGATGEGGAVTTNDAALAGAVRALRDHGQRERNRHELVGCNARLPELAAAALRIKLRRLEDWTADRRRVAARYAGALRGVPGVRLPYTAPWAEPVWHLYPVEVDHRGAVRTRLDRMGIATGVHYPSPIHLQPAYMQLGRGAGTFPEAERSAARVLSLPMYPELPDAHIDRVAQALLAAMEDTA
ncbi:DegT/DnrJ/EryC1/StrS family aminotransferase [Candidatus Solirubrobacter pratensis]|uniref:DegT/DnrJ/EryC1/StrS family aminotransferase n=1 Tax=Candidatus Solirubrobacter pratensis TaxID=1298857 RepID=UPI00040049CD|nr:DegT/DnrJ/EryC1/StrS family aminotransferase [Candidatus Solirubrobacter pratensis]